MATVIYYWNATWRVPALLDKPQRDSELEQMVLRKEEGQWRSSPASEPRHSPARSHPGERAQALGPHVPPGPAPGPGRCGSPCGDNLSGGSPDRWKSRMRLAV